MSPKTKITRQIATTKIETAALSILIENIDGVHRHKRNGETFVGNQGLCPLCKSGSQFEKAMGKIGA